MTKMLLRPPDGATFFHFAGHGCGNAHQYDGETLIDCDPCAGYVSSLSEDERINDPRLRGPVAVRGDTDAERELFAKLAAERREAASWRLVPAKEKARKDVPTEDLAAEIARLRAENERLKAAANAKPARARG